MWAFTGENMVVKNYNKFYFCFVNESKAFLFSNS